MPRTRKATKSVINASLKEIKQDKKEKKVQQAKKVATKRTKKVLAAQVPPTPSKIPKIESQALVISPSQSQALVVSPSPKKKSRPTLSIPEPTAEAILDTRSRLHVVISCSGYGVAQATKGPVTGEKAYFRPFEQKLTDVDDQALIKTLKIFGLVKQRGYKGANIPKKQFWVNDYGSRQSSDWKVSSNLLYKFKPNKTN